MSFSFNRKAAVTGLLCFLAASLWGQDSTKKHSPNLKFGFYYSSVDEKPEYFQADFSYYFTGSLGSAVSLGLLRSLEMPVQFPDKPVTKLPHDRTYVNFALKFNFRPINSEKHTLTISAGLAGVKIDESDCHGVSYKRRDDLGGSMEAQYFYRINNMFLWGTALELDYSYYFSENIGVGLKIGSRRFIAKDQVQTKGIENSIFGLNLMYAF